MSDRKTSKMQGDKPVLVRWSSKRTLLDFKKKEEESKKKGVPAPDQSLLWDLMSTYLENDVKSIQRQISDHVEYTLARNRLNFDKFGAYQATAYSVRDRLIEFWNDSNFKFEDENPKQVYYLSIEYLLGRSLQNSLLNLRIEPPFSEALRQFGFRLEELYPEEEDAGLGNGGLGRLAACYLDSMATQNFCCWGYGIRYTFGMFRQEIVDGKQAEIPDNWLSRGNPWEVTRFDVTYPVRFYGHLNGIHWEGGEVVIAVANDTPIPGYKTRNTLNLRLWSSEPSTDLDLQSFNEGNYYKALEKRQRAETISSVLYPNDNTNEGKELRLKQQYFFASATLQDIIRRFKKRGNTNFKNFPNKVAIQLNDTHPTVAIPELMRLLMDQEGLGWDEAVGITEKTFAYTNHTVMPEALERWSIPLFQHLLPRHLQIIYKINHDFLEKVVRKKWPGDDNACRRLSIIEEGPVQMVRMAHLAVVMSHRVNGVAQMHTDILKNSLFNEFHRLYPNKFLNVTNGITCRRWLMASNPSLTQLITEALEGDSFLQNLDLLEGLNNFATNPNFQEKWMAVKLQNKQRLAKFLLDHCGISVDPHALFDVHIKRIHEYKRQYLNILRVIYLYSQLLERARNHDFTGVIPKVILFAGKAAAGYLRAKSIIELINTVADVVNNNEETNKYLKVIYVPNYNVSLAEIMIPASDLSEHISTAGYEASGTSNMKFALNGGLIIGTLDGANIEIRESIGKENMFIFGLHAEKVGPTRQVNAKKEIICSKKLQHTVDFFLSGEFGNVERFRSLIKALLPPNDYYLLGNDFDSYLEAHEEVDKCFQDKAQWAEKSIRSTAGMGKFSSDRSVAEYAEKIWNISPSPPESIKLVPKKKNNPQNK